jgi:predicted transcriptional regulator
MKPSTLRNFHIPLPEELYRRLKEEACRSKQPATVLARHAIELLIEQRRKADLDAAIAAYAAQHGGTAADLDEELAVASVQHLLSEDETL